MTVAYPTHGETDWDVPLKSYLDAQFAVAGAYPYVVVVAAADSPANLARRATYVCDGTADQVEINQAIAAAAAYKTASILCLPGTYYLTGAVDFSPLASFVDATVVFEASACYFKAAGNLTSMFSIAAPAGQQLLNRLVARIGTIDAAKGTYTCTQAVYMQRTSNMKLFFHCIANSSGNGITVDQSGVTDFGCFNSVIEVVQLTNCTGTGFRVTSSNNPTQFQGNIVRILDCIANGIGFDIGSATNDAAQWNRFDLGIVQDSATVGIKDRCGRNTWLVNYTGNNPTFGVTAPTGITNPSNFILSGNQDTIDPIVKNEHLLIANGNAWFGPPVNITTDLEIGRQDNVASSPVIDFHSGATTVDHDARIVASGGNGSNDGGNLTVQAALLKLVGGIAMLTDSSHEATGASTPALGANFPGTVTTAPYKWLKLLTSDGTTVYVPAWK